MIPYGPFRPDISAINAPVCRMALNCIPAAAGFKPLPSARPASGTLPGVNPQCLGAATMIQSDGTVHSFAGTATTLAKIQSPATWVNVSRSSGGPYTTGAGERWKFEVFGELVLATTITEPIQKFNLAGGTVFSDLGGSPPRCRYMAVVRDFLVIGGIFGNERRVQWSGLNDVEHWTAGTSSSDFQDFPSGGPVRGVIGGEVGWVFQSEKVTRMNFVPDSQSIFQFDEVQGGRGLAAPHSLVRVGTLAYYMASDGFYEFNLSSGGSRPLGIGKWARWFLDDIRRGTELVVLGGVDPSRQLIIWAYVPRSSSSFTPTRIILYDWALEEATIADVPVMAMSQWLTQGVSLDQLGQYADLDHLPFSLDSPVWRGGVGLLGLFGPDNTLSYLNGSPMAAQFITSDGQRLGRTFITGTRPSIDTRKVTVAIAAREADGDPVTFGPSEAMEDTGVCPAHSAGNLLRAKIDVEAGATWSLAQGLGIAEPKKQGRR